ncbi:MAG: SpoIIE family protein phosphatase [Candidatus Zixiibacteriota bacterium]
MYKLVGTDGQRFYSFPLSIGKFIIGRKDNCEFTIPNNTISRQHAEITVNCDGQEIFLTDLGSHNGTFVNDKKIDKLVTIKPGDSIKFGSTDFKIASAEDSKQTAAPTRNKIIASDSLQKSVVFSLNEILKPSEKKTSDIPELVSTISDMAKMLVVNEPEQELLNRSLKLISRVIDAERLAILFVSGNQENIEVGASLLPKGKDPGAFNLSQTIVNEVITNRNAVLLGNPKEDPRFAEQQSIIMSNLQSAMAVPLFDQDRVLGILYADSINPARKYNNEHVRIFAIFGNIIASRLSNLSLLADREANCIFEAELQRASEIQKNLLVTTAPEFSGFSLLAHQEQSRSVGGDLYDMNVLPDGRLLFLVADVSGKGTGAALLMSNILAAFRILYASKEFNLLEIVKQVSLQMFHYTEADVFATLFIGIIDNKNGQVQYVNAGHNPPLLLRYGSRTVEYIDPTGVMIGAFDFVDWTAGMIEMASKDKLFIFTDGVTEAESNSGQYGEARLEKISIEAIEKPAKDFIDYLMEDVRLFVGSAPQSDDITIMVLEKD